MKLWQACLGSFFAAVVFACGGRAEGGEGDDALGPPRPPAAPPPAYRGDTAPAPATSNPPPAQTTPDPASALDDWDRQRQVVEDMLGRYCGSCHGAAAIANDNVAAFDFVEDIDELVQSGLIIPLNAAASPLFGRIRNGDMPPRGWQPRPSQSEIRAFESFIDGDDLFWGDAPRR